MVSHLQDDAEEMSEINMTPLVDVMLVLLIIFMVTLPVMHHGVKLDLPQASSRPQAPPPERIVLALDADGVIFWGTEKLDAAALESRLAAAARHSPQPEIQLRADRRTAYDHVAQVLSAASRQGLSKVALLTRPGE